LKRKLNKNPFAFFKKGRKRKKKVRIIQMFPKKMKSPLKKNDKNDDSISQLQQVHYTIDDTHNDIMTDIEKNREVEIPKLKEELKKLKQRIQILEKVNGDDKKSSSKLENKNIERLLDLRDKLVQKTMKMKELKYKERNYLLNNSKFVFDYFENKKDISSGKGRQNKEKVLHFFKLDIKKNIEKESQKANTTFHRLNYYQYWHNLHDDPLFSKKMKGQKMIGCHDDETSDDNMPSKHSDGNTDLCQRCRVGEVVSYEEEGILICNNRECGRYTRYIIDTSRPSSKDPQNEVSYTAYIRLNHFKEILAQFQAKETTHIPVSVIECIKNRIKKERITDFEKNLTYAKMREILRKLGLNKYFEHIQYINSLFGIKAPKMSDELFQTLCILFIEIQHPYTIHCPANRTNFFNYTYTFYQLCVLLDQTQYLPYIPLLKDRQKQLEQDHIWAKICIELDWEFIPTV
jgi:Poxvirus Late Transcription Factor VLTF3 like